MAGKYTGLQKTYKISDADGIAMYLGVVADGAGKCKKPAADNAILLGVVCNDERDAQNVDVAVQLDGIAEIEAGDVITAGDRVILKTGGTVIPMPETGNDETFNVVGFAEASAVAGDIIPVRLAYHTFYYKATV